MQTLFVVKIFKFLVVKGMSISFMSKSFPCLSSKVLSMPPSKIWPTSHKMCSQEETFHCYGNKRIKNKVACLENWLESRRNLRLTCYHLEYGPDCEAKFFLSQDLSSRSSCPSSLRFSCLYQCPCPPKGSENTDPGLELRMGEHCWLTCTWVWLFSSQRAFPHGALLPSMDAKLCLRFQLWAAKSQIFSAIGEVREMWMKIWFWCLLHGRGLWNTDVLESQDN